MKRMILCLSIVGLLALGSPAVAEICTIDAVPAATLLVPYFEVDLNNADGITTLFSVNNASAASVLAHVTLWTDFSVPTIDFDVYLTGFDVQTFNVRDLFHGVIPQTANDNAFSNQGAFSDPHPSLAALGCSAGDLPVGNVPNVLLTQLLIPAHTGQSVPFFGGLCAGADDDDGIAKGYITIDYVEACSTAFPSTLGYFDNIAGFENVLWGDYFYVDPDENFAQGETLVHIEACPNPSVGVGGPCEFVPGDYTFYGRYVNFLATDQREPLSTTFATRYVEGGAFDGGTDLICWRDPNEDIDPFSCANGSPPQFPLSQRQVVIFDEEENPFQVPEVRISPGIPGEDVLICPREAGRSAASNLPLQSPFGWLFLNLNLPDGPLPGAETAQAWVTTIMSASGRFSVGFDAIQLDSACEGVSITLGPGGATITPTVGP
jgi:hypothetical protein